MRMKAAALTTALALTLHVTAIAQQPDPFAETPFGASYEGWDFYQRPAVMGGTLCRAVLGELELGIFTDAGDRDGTAAVPPAGTKQFYNNNAVFDIGRMSEQVTAMSDGPQDPVKFVFRKALLDEIAANGGYSWSVGKFSDTVTLPASVVGAVATLKDCVTANAPATAAAPPPAADPNAETPFGAPYEGWEFTQQPATLGGVYCRALLGELELGIYSTDLPDANGQAVVPPAGTKKFVSSDAVLDIGRISEKVTAMANGPDERLSFMFRKELLDEIAANRGYSWSVGNFSDTVTLPDSVDGAVATLKDCVTANQPVASNPPPPPAEEDPFAETPFGADYEGWSFYQSVAMMGGQRCRAVLGEYDLALYTQPWDGKDASARVPAAGTRKFFSNDAVIDTGRMSEKVTATSEGPDDPVSFIMHKALIEEIAANRGYSWSVGKFSDTVAFPDSVIGAVETLKDCVTANGG